MCLERQNSRVLVHPCLGWCRQQACCLVGKIVVLSSIIPLSLAASWMSRSLRSTCCFSIMLDLSGFEPPKSFVQTLYSTGVVLWCRGSGLRSSRILILSLSLLRFSVMICLSSAGAYLYALVMRLSSSSLSMLKSSSTLRYSSELAWSIQTSLSTVSSKSSHLLLYFD